LKSYEIDPILDRRRVRGLGDRRPAPTRSITISKACANYTGILPSLAVRQPVHRCEIQTPDLCGGWPRSARKKSGGSATKDMPPVERLEGLLCHRLGEVEGRASPHHRPCVQLYKVRTAPRAPWDAQMTDRPHSPPSRTIGAVCQNQGGGAVAGNPPLPSSHRLFGFPHSRSQAQRVIGKAFS